MLRNVVRTGYRCSFKSQYNIFSRYNSKGTGYYISRRIGSAATSNDPFGTDWTAAPQQQQTTNTDPFANNTSSAGFPQQEGGEVNRSEAFLAETRNIEPQRNFSEHYSQRTRHPKWTPEEQDKLAQAVADYGKDWKVISRDVFAGFRGALGCETRYMTQTWTPEMTQRLFAAVEEHGTKWERIHSDHFPDWSERALQIWYEKFKGRSGAEESSGSRQRKNVDESDAPRRRLWTEEEIETLRSAVKEHGTDFELISRDVFKFSRSPLALQIKYDQKIGPNKDKYSGSERKKRYSNEVPTFFQQDYTKLLDENGNLLVDQSELHSKLGSELTRAWSHIARMMGPHVNKLQLTYDTPPISTVLPSQVVHWSKSENETLFTTAKETNNDWTKIAESLPGKSLDEIKNRFGSPEWSAEEIDLLHEAMKEHDTDWTKISNKVPGKSPGQCWSYWRRSTGADLADNEDNKEKSSEIATATSQNVRVDIQMSGNVSLEFVFARTNEANSFTFDNTSQSV
ncbi:8440_t:CDS:2 [Paraglomus occultum]|uniref:8440_t:CDS:1 n=1 Tax=Paraglomus occultum TaxID=144539 RepID=A0A9N8VUA9_9GLOM|nr:8440_t:CDS:2 [Paraglomus occultum]